MQKHEDFVQEINKQDMMEEIKNEELLPNEAHELSVKECFSRELPKLQP